MEARELKKNLKNYRREIIGDYISKDDITPEIKSQLCEKYPDAKYIILYDNVHYPYSYKQDCGIFVGKRTIRDYDAVEVYQEEEDYPTWEEAQERADVLDRISNKVYTNIFIVQLERTTCK